MNTYIYRYTYKSSTYIHIYIYIHMFLYIGRENMLCVGLDARTENRQPHLRISAWIVPIGAIKVLTIWMCDNDVID